MSLLSSTMIALLSCNCCETICFSGAEVIRLRNHEKYFLFLESRFIIGDGDDDEDSDDQFEM